jgi:hypothetical protein
MRGEATGREVTPHPSARAATFSRKGRRTKLLSYAAAFLNWAASVESLRAMVDEAPPEMVIATWSK